MTRRTFEDVVFERDHHKAILTALRTLDGEFFAQSGCFFGGGTAIVLALGEYRESVDIDFLCASQAGYRAMRSALAGREDMQPVLREGSSLECLRTLRADQYGVRSAIKTNGVIIKFEIVREARIALSGAIDDRYGVPVLDRHCMYAEKILANSDRWYAPEATSRDIIDLSMMISRWGPIPQEAWEIAEAAYGEKAREDYAKAVEKIRHPEHIEDCARKMQIESAIVDEVLAVHGGAYDRTPSPFD